MSEYERRMEPIRAALEGYDPDLMEELRNLSANERWELKEYLEEGRRIDWMYIR